MNRVEKIRKKYGANIYRVWGRKGGNPLLISQGKGYRITVHKNSKR